jgi:formate hydrogenlyase subunit 6/NADH:ubiquinone oxidoreductase subunit I
LHPAIDPSFLERNPGILDDRLRAEMPMLTGEERSSNFNEVERGFSEAAARKEGARCFGCGVRVCIGCNVCAEVCPDYVISIASRVNGEGQRYPTDYVIDFARCMYCSLCVEYCPTHCLNWKPEFYEASEEDKKRLFYGTEKLRLYDRQRKIHRVEEIVDEWLPDEPGEWEYK